MFHLGEECAPAFPTSGIRADEKKAIDYG